MVKKFKEESYDKCINKRAICTTGKIAFCKKQINILADDIESHHGNLRFRAILS